MGIHNDFLMCGILAICLILVNAIIILRLIPLAMKGIKYKLQFGEDVIQQYADLRFERRDITLYRHQDDQYYHTPLLVLLGLLKSSI